MKKRMAVYICCMSILCVLIAGQSRVTAQEVSKEGTTQEVSGEETTQEETAAVGSTMTESTDRILANGLFSVTMPEEVEGLYVGLIDDRSIFICDKKSREEGAPGMVFEISAKEPTEEYCYIPSLKKYGELTSSDGTIYDMTFRKPTDAQASYKDGKRSETYDKLLDSGVQVMGTIAGTEGGFYTAGAGIKGEDLYQDVLKKYVTAINEKWNSALLEEEGMSPAYELIGKIYGEAALDRICYAYSDLTDEGVEELLVGEIPDGEQVFKIYDIYTIKEHKPVHVLSGWNENWYVVGELYLYNVYRGLNGEEYWSVHSPDYSIVYEKTKGYSNGMDIFVIDPSRNEDQPWFFYDGPDNWKNVSREEYEERYNRIVKVKEIEPKPLSELADDR